MHYGLFLERNESHDINIADEDAKVDAAIILEITSDLLINGANDFVSSFNLHTFMKTAKL